MRLASLHQIKKPVTRGCIAGDWDPATYRSSSMPEAPISPHYSVGAVVAAATSTLDPDLTPEDRALQARTSRPLPHPCRSFCRSCPPPLGPRRACRRLSDRGAGLTL